MSAPGSSRANAEEVIPLLENLQKQRAALRQKETQFSARQRQLDLIYQTIRDERAAMEKLVQEFRDELREIEEQMKTPAKPRPHSVMSETPLAAPTPISPRQPTSRTHPATNSGTPNSSSDPGLHFLQSLHVVLRNLLGPDVLDCAVSIFHRIHDRPSTVLQGS